MKRLWKVIPPCISDLIGFEAVMNETDGLGIIDDSSTYKPVRFGRGGQGRPGGGGEMRHEYRAKGGEMECSSSRMGDHDMDGHGPGSHGMDGHGPGGHGMDGHGPGGHGMDGHGPGGHGMDGYGPGGRGMGGHGHGGGRGLFPGMRVLNSDIRNEDIITGTESKVLSAFERGAGQLSPDFVLLAYGPSASMIGSDLEYAAEKIARMSGLPAASVKIDGEKDYLYGIGCTLETLGRMLLAPQQTIPGTVNLLGGNTIDWAKETVDDVEKLLTQDGWQILSRWGTKETTEHLKMASAAAVNLVVNESGLRLARYMESEFGIPFIAGAPFGTANTQLLRKELEALKREFLVTEVIRSGALETDAMKSDVPKMNMVSEVCGKNAECDCAEGCASPRNVRSDGAYLQARETPQASLIKKEQILVNERPLADEAPEILIVGEQFMANAIRQELLRRGQKGIRVLSFYDMDKACMLPGDKKLVSEDDFAAQASAASVRVILADADCRPLVKKEVQWVSLPNGGSMFPIEPMEPFNMTGGALDVWLDRTVAEIF